MRWHSVHVYYHDDRAPLIRHAVRPLFDRLRGQVEATSYTRHWRLGPHLRLNFRTGEQTFEQVVRPAVDEIVGGYLRMHPSTTDLDPRALLAQHRRLAELEQETGPLLPWQPNNSMSVAPFDRRVAALGDEAIADLVAEFHADSTELALRITEEVTDRPALLSTAFDLMIATAHGLDSGGITRGFISFRSHAEGFLCGFPEGAGLRGAWDEHYRLGAAKLTARTADVVSTVDGRGGAVRYVREWVAVLGGYRKAAARLPGGGVLPVSAPSADSPSLDAASPFHQRLFANPGWRDMQRSPDFRNYRLVLNLTYLQLTRLGVRPVERQLLCHLAANAVEQHYAVSAYDAVGRPFSESGSSR